MTETLTIAQMRALETDGITQGKTTGLALMERAGEGVVTAILREWPVLAGGTRRAVVLCGPGNNGGDGMVIARHLHLRGWKVRVFLLGAGDKLPPDAAENCRRWQEYGPLYRCPTPGAMAEGVTGKTFDTAPDVCVDALFGIGLARPLPGALGGVLRARGGAARLVAVDILSGINANTGGAIVNGGADMGHADLTVTFHALKKGHITPEGRRACPKTVVVDIGL